MENKSKVTDSYLTEDAKNIYNELLGNAGGAGNLFVVINAIQDGTYYADGDMSKKEIYESLQNGSLVILKIFNQQTGVYQIGLVSGDRNTFYMHPAISSGDWRWVMSISDNQDNKRWTYGEL